MKNKDFIVSNAMLSAFLGKQSKDCLDLMKPFVLYLLPQVNSRIDINSISRRMNTEFGFSNVPDNVIGKILKRLAKKKEYVRYEDGYYVVIETYDTSTFEQKKRDITEKVNRLANQFADFVKNEGYSLLPIDEEKARQYIQEFLEHYNYIYTEVDAYRRITGTTEAKSNYWVARFVISGKEANAQYFDDFLEIVKGSLAAQAVTFWAEDKSGNRRKLQNTVFYFDTTLLINCLGLRSKEEQHATAELKNLIESNGGKIRTFPQYIEELHGILTKYIMSPQDRPGLGLDYFGRNHVSVEYVRQYRDALESYLEKQSIYVDEKPNCSIPIENLDWPIDVLALKKTVSDCVTYKQGKKGEIQLSNDVETLENISILRYNLKGKTYLENCKAIFVTPNSNLTYAAHQYFKTIEHSKGIELAVNDVELTAWLWLNYGKNINEFPKMKLLENAYTACCPSEEVLNEFMNIVNLMREEGELTEQQAQVIRQGNMNISTLVDKSNNDPSCLHEADVKECITEYFESLNQMVQKNYEKEFHALSDAQKEFEKENEKANRQLERREKEVATREKYLSVMETEQKKKVSRQREEDREKQMKKAQEDANKAKKVVKAIGNTIAVLIAVIVIVLCAKATLFDIIAAIRGGGQAPIPFCVLLFVSFCGAVAIILDVLKDGAHLVNVISQKVFDFFYNRYMEKYLPD